MITFLTSTKFFLTLVILCPNLLPDSSKFSLAYRFAFFPRPADPRNKSFHKWKPPEENVTRSENYVARCAPTLPYDVVRCSILHHNFRSMTYPPNNVTAQRIFRKDNFHLVRACLVINSETRLDSVLASRIPG